MRVGLVGYSGRMGQLIVQAIDERDEFCLASVYVRDSQILEGVYATSDWQDFLRHCDVVIDFSSHSGTQNLLLEVQKSPKPLVIGTTGLSKEIHAKLGELSQAMPIVYATNTSRGIAILNQLALQVSSALKDADIEIVEIHHHHKQDAPSGTAMTLAKYCAEGRGWDLDSIRISGRDGNIGARKKEEIGVMSLRGGDIVGRHTVGFYCDGEYLELTHNATSRKTFAFGALEAAKWVISHDSGLYEMRDVLNL